jgi:hypothetical protein
MPAFDPESLRVGCTDMFSAEGDQLAGRHLSISLAAIRAFADEIPTNLLPPIPLGEAVLAPVDRDIEIGRLGLLIESYPTTRV